MSEGKKRIAIGGEYRESFANLLKVLRSGYLAGGSAYADTDSEGRDLICTDTTEYVFDENAALKNTGGVALSMENDGASWFAPVREGKAFDDGMSEWKQLIYKVAREFHDKFSIIEYKQFDDGGNGNLEAVENNIRKILRRFYSRSDVSVIRGVDRDKGCEDIYGATVKLELSGTGQSHFVVMSKIYFRRNGNTVTPLTGAEAAEINARLEEAQDNDDPVSLSEADSADINNVTVNAVRELVSGRYPVSFKDSLCFSTRRAFNAETGKSEDNYDLKTYKKLASRAYANKSAVTCNSVQVLGVSHVRWVNDYFDVAFGGKVCLKAIVGFGGSISLRCVNCGGANLITSNVISYKFTDKNGLTHSENIVLDYSVDDLGLSEEKLAEIKTYGEFNNHLNTVGCFNSRLGKQCTACVCRSQTISVGGETKCADCPYPEVVYTDYTGDRPVRYLTSKLTFVHDRLAMVLEENAALCSRCGRSFSKEALSGGQCRLCNSIDGLSEEEQIKAKKLYNKYKNAFSHAERAKHLSAKKFCLEDDTALVFALGRDTYVLDKLDLLSGSGFVSKPQKIK
ncbi:MAG: hypothetical protein K2K39_02030 [Clostridia bacterium]|nr:hypothetical protein [Clostridia bacterium]